MLETDYSYWAILLAGMLPYTFTVIAKAGRMKLEENRDPRAYMASLDGYRKRAVNAQKNSFESFPLFAAGVLVAHQTTEDLNIEGLNVVCGVYLLCRVLYGAAYLTDWHQVRSCFWFGGLGAAAALFWV